MKNFIKTTDKETADTLLSLGFTLLSDDNGCYVFFNCKNITFEKSSLPKNCVYTNVLCV